MNIHNNPGPGRCRFTKTLRKTDGHRTAIVQPSYGHRTAIARPSGFMQSKSKMAGALHAPAKLLMARIGVRVCTRIRSTSEHAYKWLGLCVGGGHDAYTLCIQQHKCGEATP